MYPDVLFDCMTEYLKSPTYSTRRGNRYRYYVSCALVRGRKADEGSQGRVGADDVRGWWSNFSVISCPGPSY